MKNNSEKAKKIDNIPKKNEIVVKNENKLSPKVKSFLYIGGVVIAILVLAFGISFYQNSLRLNNYQNVLEGVYRSSYFNMVDKVNSVSVDADKLASASDENAQLLALRNISKNCDSIVASLSLLSIDSENVIELTRFFNQLGGLADAYSDKIYKGENLSEKDLSQIDRVCSSLNKVKERINPHNDSITTGEYVFTSESVMKNGKSPFSASLGDMTADSMDYPSMIFDGPFSAALDKKDVKGLNGEFISIEKAKDILKNKVFLDKKVRILDQNETNADLESYNFEVSVLEKKYYVQISKKGGMLLTMSGEVESAQPKIDDKEAVSVAQGFVKRLGLSDMKIVWQESYDNLAYFNFAPLQDSCILYPDLVKVKVNKTTGDVVGWDAQNYAYNHATRSVDPAISEEEARDVLNTNEQVDSSSLAIIPLENGREALTYEFVTERSDGVYYVYVSAENKSILKTMKEITTDKVHKLI